MWSGAAADPPRSEQPLVTDPRVYVTQQRKPELGVEQLRFNLRGGTGVTRVFHQLSTLGDGSIIASNMEKRQATIHVSAVSECSRIQSLPIQEESNSGRSAKRPPSRPIFTFIQEVPNPKRRRKQDLNYRYDRMIETMRMTDIYPQGKVSKKKISTNSKPSSTHRKGPDNSPRCSLEHPGGYSKKAFTSIRPSASHNRQTKERISVSDSDSKGEHPSTCSPVIKQPLPKWLARTVATLPHNHPLRFLLPPGHRDTGSYDICLSSDSTAVETTSPSPEFNQPIFALDVDDAPTSPTLVPSKLDVPCTKLAVSDAHALIECFSSPYRQATGVIRRVGTICSSPYIKPFSTPGPASTISRPLTPPQLAFKAYDFNMPCSPYLSPGGYLLGQEFNAAEPDDGIPVLLDDPGDHQEARTGISFLANAGDLHTECDALSGLYASPGPCYSARHPVYFDSPVEDCLSLDSSSESCHIDIDELDFQWTVFDRKGLHQGSFPGNKLSDTVSYTFDRGIHVQDSRELQDARQDCLIDESSSPGESKRFRFQAVLDVVEPDLHEDQGAGESRKPFAPTAGIFLSPLKGLTPSASEGGNFRTSVGQSPQRSRDGIKSLSD